MRSFKIVISDVLVHHLLHVLNLPSSNRMVLVLLLIKLILKLSLGL